MSMFHFDCSDAVSGMKIWNYHKCRNLSNDIKIWNYNKCRNLSNDIDCLKNQITEFHDILCVKVQKQKDFYSNISRKSRITNLKIHNIIVSLVILVAAAQTPLLLMMTLRMALLLPVHIIKEMDYQNSFHYLPHMIAACLVPVVHVQ